MKITDVNLHLVTPVGKVRLSEGQRLGWLFVEVETDEGITGVGECSNWPSGGNAIVGRALEVIREAVIGAEAMHVEHVWQTLFRRHTFLGARGLVTTIMSGIDIALWDIRGKALGRPVYELLGGALHDEIPLYTHPHWGDTPDELFANARALVAEGYGAIKVDPFVETWPKLATYRNGVISRAGIRAAAEGVAVVREAIGPDVELMIDAHGNYNVPCALACIRALEPYDIAMFEEPVPPEGLDALRQIRRQTNVDLCVGERLHTRWDFLPILQEGLASYLMPDVCWTGGISELRRIAALAEPYFVPVMPHNALGPIQIVAGAHTMMATPNFHRLEIHRHWFDLYEACVTPALDIVDGSLRLGDRPGLGVELDRDFLARHADEEWSARWTMRA